MMYTLVHLFMCPFVHLPIHLSTNPSYLFTIYPSLAYYSSLQTKEYIEICMHTEPKRQIDSTGD